MNNSWKKLFDVFMEIENSQYPEFMQEQLDMRTKLIEKLIEEFGVDHTTITVNTMTNMMLPMYSMSITLDTYVTSRSNEGDITIDIGSEPHEISAIRDNHKEGTQIFNFKEWKWEKYSFVLETKGGRL